MESHALALDVMIMTACIYDSRETAAQRDTPFEMSTLFPTKTCDQTYNILCVHDLPLCSNGSDILVDIWQCRTCELTQQTLGDVVQVCTVQKLTTMVVYSEIETETITVCSAVQYIALR